MTKYLRIKNYRETFVINNIKLLYNVKFIRYACGKAGD